MSDLDLVFMIYSLFRDGIMSAINSVPFLKSTYLKAPINKNLQLDEQQPVCTAMPAARKDRM